MTLEGLNHKVREWDLRGGSLVAGSKFSTIFDQLNYHSKNEWRDYVPAMHSNFTQSYMERLAAWIGNVSSEADQMLLFEYASCISFFSHADFQALYRTAMHREIYRWVAVQIGARLETLGSQAFHENVHKQINEHTWFCPITDSMDINEFYKANHLQGVGHRPGFATLEMLAERAATKDQLLASNIASYMANPSLDPLHPQPALERIVLLEDIVGSGSQCIDAVKWAVGNLGKPVLFIPLILCPNGVEALRAVEVGSGGALTVRPVVELRRGDLLGPERQGQTGWSITSPLEDFILRNMSQLSLEAEYAFGYNKTGCSLATFSNTPDNTIPIVWLRKADSWEPLFPRVYRGMT